MKTRTGWKKKLDYLIAAMIMTKGCMEKFEHGG